MRTSVNAQAQSGALEALQAREIDLRQSLGKMEAQRSVLLQQANDASIGTYRDRPRTQLMQMDIDMAGAKSELESVRQQISSLGGRTENPETRIVVETDPHRSFLDRIDDSALTGMSFMVLLAVLLPISLGLGRRFWRRAAPPPSQSRNQDEALTRLGRLEQAVDAIAIEIERVSEGQRYVTKVMSDRPHASASSEMSDASALGDAKPFLALGAGPIEPIRMAERQAVRQSITPH